MEKREPSLVPEWLRSSGPGSGGGSSNHLLSSSHSDSSSLSYNSKNRTSRSKSDVDSVRSPFLDWSSSNNTRKGYSNGSTKHPYSSFNFSRSHRDKDRSREKDRLSYMDPWDHDTSFPLKTFFFGRDQEQLRRSHSMKTRKQGDHFARAFTMGPKNGQSINMCNREGTLTGTFPAKSSKNTGFDKDFPFLRAEETNGIPDVVRISSPGLSPAVQSFSVSNSALVVGEGWTSALAEVPNVFEKTVAGSHANVGSLATLAGPTCRNMAEALVQAPARTGTPPQGSVEIQRLEDRAIKQSRQLIPVVPSALKGSVLNSSDKSKTKPMVRNGETGLVSSRNSQQRSSMLLGNPQCIPGSQIKRDTNKKLVVLKPARENRVVTDKESGSLSGITNSGAAGQMTAALPAEVASSVRSKNSPRDLKGASVNMIAGKTVEKKPSLAQTQSRNAFFSALKQKTCTNISTDQSKTSSYIFASAEEKANSSKELVASDASSELAAERDEIMERVEKVSEAIERNSCFELADRPDEKEAEFLKSLGWDENNSEEDEALTEEEIREFIEQCKKFKPSLMQKLPIIQEPTEDVTPES